jgi:flavin-binding protein dodecin
MSVAKIIEISATSPTSFEEAVREGVSRACRTLKDVKSAWVEGQQVMVEDGRVTGYRVALKVTFVLHDDDDDDD